MSPLKIQWITYRFDTRPEEEWTTRNLGVRYYTDLDRKKADYLLILFLFFLRNKYNDVCESGVYNSKVNSGTECERVSCDRMTTQIKTDF